jgi:hypothetical protein
MTAPNPLIAPRQDSTEWDTGLGLIESAGDTVAGITGGSWVEAGVGAAGTGLEALGLMVDPVGTLVGWGVAWLMEHLQPLSDALDWLAGDPDAIASYAATWRSVGQAVGTARTDFDRAVSTETAAWTGAAGDAHRSAAARQSESIGAASIAAHGVGDVVEIVGTLVGVVRETVRDLIADCVATLIARLPQWLAEIAATFGLATPHVVASAVSLISRWVARISEVITKLVRSIQNLSPLLRRLDEIWATLRDALRNSIPISRADAPTSPSTTPGGPAVVPDPTADIPTVSADGGRPTSPAASPTTSPVADTPTVHGADTPATTTPAGAAPNSPAEAPTVRGAGTPSSSNPAASSGGSVTDAPTVRADNTPFSSPTGTTPDAASSAPAARPFADSGGRRRPPESDYAGQSRWAERAYDEFRATDADVDAIARNTGYSRADIADVKRHLFEDEHPLNVYDDNGNVVGTEMRRFDADPDIADAWIRMADGRATPSDLRLLDHELAELNYMRDHPGATYSDAHRHANTVSNWEDNAPPASREDLDNLPWYRDGTSSYATPAGGDTPPQTGARAPDAGQNPPSTSPISQALDGGTPDHPVGADVAVGGTAAPESDSTAVHFGDRDPSDPYPSTVAGPPFEAKLDSILADYGLTRDEFHDLAAHSADNLTPEQVQIVHDVRHQVELRPDTVVSKALPEDVARHYLTNSTYNGFDPTIAGGFFARHDDMTAINSPAGLYDGLALGYQGTPFSPSDERTFVLRVSAENTAFFSIPFGGNTSGSSPITGFESGQSGIAEQPTFFDPPFTGTGFTASETHIIPEFRRAPAPIPDGAVIYEIDPHGHERVVGTYNEDVGWTPVDGGIR